MRAEVNSINIPGLRDTLRDTQETYENELDNLANILQLFTPARFRRGITDVDRRVERELDLAITARAEKEKATKCWWRDTRRVLNLQNMIKVAEEEPTSLQAVEQLTRDDCYCPIVELARVWTSCMGSRARDP